VSILSRHRPARLLSAAARRLPEILDDLKLLVECESPSAAPAALHACADRMEGLVLTRVGRRVEWRGEELPHLRWRWGGPANRVLMLTHFDTVWPLGTLADFPFSHEDGVVRGPGSFDMKAGIVIAVHALAVLREVDGDGALDGICLLSTADEELGSGGSRPLIEKEAAGCRAALVFEGAGVDGALKTARKGTSHYVLRVHGKASHAGLEPERGVNSALDASRLTIAAAELSDPARGTTVTPTLVTAGTSRNTVPDLAEISLDVRAADPDEQRRVDDALRRLVAEPSPIGCGIELVGGPNRPPMTGRTSAALYATARRVNRALDLPELTQVSVGGGSDGNLTAALGIPTLDGLGAVGGGAHTREERVSPDRLVDRVALVAALLAELLDHPTTGDDRG